MQKAKSLEQLDKQTVLSLLEAADRVRRHFNEILRARGLTGRRDGARSNSASR